MKKIGICASSDFVQFLRREGLTGSLSTYFRLLVHGNLFQTQQSSKRNKTNGTGTFALTRIVRDDGELVP